MSLFRPNGLFNFFIVVSVVNICLCNSPPYQHGQRLDGRGCNCSGRSDKCYFDLSLWEQTGHGGHCTECRENTEGPNCEHCKDNHYQRRDGRCIPCNCDPTGSHSLQCDDNAKCNCKHGVGGKRCNQCLPNYHRLSPQGCSPCECYAPGITKDRPGCDTITGRCRCKEYVEGPKCDRCKEGFFDIEEDNEFGCISCFCYGRSKDCRSTLGYYQAIIDTSFDTNEEGWTGKDYHNLQVRVYHDPDLRVLQLRSTDSHTMYFIAPDRYLGDQRASYNQYLSFELRIAGEDARASAEDVIIEGGGLKVALPIIGQKNPMPESRSSQTFKFRLHEHPTFGWQPRLRFHDFMRILSNVTAIKIRGIYLPGSIAFLDNVRLESAGKTPSKLDASWIETCSCPTGYVGQSCERCATGYTRNPPGGTPFDRCVPCSCHNHADICDPEWGHCACKYNTIGNKCDKCAPGYYGTVIRGTPEDCKPCPCPNRGACVVLPGGNVACRECDIGHTGPSCDLCVDGYYGDPSGRYGAPRPCRRCDCNDNVDPNAVGNCNATTGQCLKCIYNTAGRNCERCKAGFYGYPLSLPKRGCKPCNCYPPGTVQQEQGATACDPVTGQCRCRPNVVGLSCDSCEEHYWNIGSSRGCEKCNCHLIGSVNNTCDVRTGQCRCLPGVIEKRCDTCRPYYYGLSQQGCKPCNCDPEGSLSLQCDFNGQCPCRPNMQGRQCSQCRENKFPKGTLCLDCPACYTLVEEEVDYIKEKLAGVMHLLKGIKKYPVTENDFDFRRKLSNVRDMIEQLLRDATRAAGQEKTLLSELDDLWNRIEEVRKTSGKIAIQTEAVRPSNLQAERNITEAEEVIRHIQDAVKATRDYLDTRGRKALEDAMERSEKYGKQSERMSEIAREARQLADQHQETAEVIKQQADDAYNMSSEAYQLARKTIDSQERLSGEVYALDKKLDDIEDMMRRTKKLAADAHREGEEAYDQALDVYTDVNSLIVPETNERRMKDEAAHIIEEAQRIQREVDEGEELHKESLDNLKVKQEEVNQLLEAAVYQQQITDGLLADADLALAKGREAVQLGDDTLKEAKKTLKTLRDFDDLVQESKSKADAALDDVPAITALIEDAETRTKEAEDALGNAKQDAFGARDIAKQAEKIAEEASKNARDLLGEAEQTKALAGRLKEQGDDLTIQIEDTDERIRELEKQSVKDNELSNAALQRAGESKNNALDTSKKAKDTLDDLNDLIRQLNNLDQVDDSALKELEKKLLKAEKEMRDSDLDAKLAAMRDVRRQQAGWMKNYEDEIEMLQNEVKNIEEIRKALPDGCYRRVKLEP